jgi:hypothetical protein
LLKYSFWRSKFSAREGFGVTHMLFDYLGNINEVHSLTRRLFRCVGFLYLLSSLLKAGASTKHSSFMQSCWSPPRAYLCEFVLWVILNVCRNRKRKERVWILLIFIFNSTALFEPVCLNHSSDAFKRRPFELRFLTHLNKLNPKDHHWRIGKIYQHLFIQNTIPVK